jgi:hypothetical protein
VAQDRSALPGSPKVLYWREDLLKHIGSVAVIEGLAGTATGSAVVDLLHDGDVVVVCGPDGIRLDGLRRTSSTSPVTRLQAPTVLDPETMVDLGFPRAVAIDRRRVSAASAPALWDN